MPKPMPNALVLLAARHGVLLRPVKIGFPLLPWRRRQAWKGLCPFHHEETPSFYVHDDSTFRCMSCGAAGGVEEFAERLGGAS